MEISSGAHCWLFVSRSQGTRNTRISRNNARASSNAVEEGPGKGVGRRGEKKGGHRRRTEAREGRERDAKHRDGQSAGLREVVSREMGGGEKERGREGIYIVGTMQTSGKMPGCEMRSRFWFEFNKKDGGRSVCGTGIQFRNQAALPLAKTFTANR